MMISSVLTRTWKHSRWKHLFNHNLTLGYNDPRSTNITISQHINNGELKQARKLFDEMPNRTVDSWNIMVSAYYKLGDFSESLNLVSLMHHENVYLNETTFSSILSVCARSQSLPQGKQIHGLILKSGHEDFEYVGSGMVYLYSSLCKIDEARKVFDLLNGKNKLVWSVMLVGYVQCNLMAEALDSFNKMPKQDVFAWTSLISGFSKSEDNCLKALELFWKMRSNYEAAPNEFTFDCIVRVCGKLGAYNEGKIVHGQLIKFGYEFEQSINSALISFYCNSKMINEAKTVYKSLLNPCTNNSNALLEGLLTMNRIKEAELIFNRLSKNPTSYNLMIKGYAKNGLIKEAKRLYHESPMGTLVSSNTMISVYSKEGKFGKALKIFEKNKEERNSITWNSMISVYIQNDQNEKAVKLYVTMRRLLISQTRSTFSSILKACSSLGCLQQGQIIHADLYKTPFELNIYVKTALIDMYSKCGSISDAEKSFSYIYNPNIVSFTALINGYAHHGKGYESILLYEQMLEREIIPNAATFVGVLSACTHSGLVNEGIKYFNIMQNCYGITPSLEHYTCVVDLLGKSGKIIEAEEFIKHMPIEPDKILLVSLLNACWFWMDIKVAERVAKRIFRLDRNDVSTNVILSKIYAKLGRWGKKSRVRKIVNMNKDPGCSWIEINSIVYVFTVDDKNHRFSNVIYPTLQHLTANVNSCAKSDIFSLIG